MKIIPVIHVLLLVSSVLLCRPEQKYKIPQSETIFIHGLDGSPKKLDTLIADTIIQHPAKSFDLQNGYHAPLGQGAHIETVKKHIDATNDCCIATHSCGGATTVSLPRKI